ncbi:MAG TPA: ATP synthase F1 subunit delta [Candidatus Acidoferrales bacterium]|nr:ATP synthase F1 subunit delta [Candidatus Acidoferrales bacterium]
MASVTSRYARAFADVVAERKLNADTAKAQLATLTEVFEASSDLRRVWEAPSVPAEQKRAVLDALLARVGNVPRELRNFIAVLIDHGRIAALPQIAGQFSAEMNQRLGIVEADITSARALSEAERQQLLLQLSQLTGSKVAPRYAIDETLLGGAQVRVGSTVYDGSVRGQLERMRQQLAGEQ